MQVGINQDIVFKDERFHVQTEDSGVKRPVITTTLFKGGLVIASRKIGYEDKLNSANLENEVKGLMQSQHEAIISALKNNEFEKPKKERIAEKDGAACPPVQNLESKRPLKVTKQELEDKVLECLSLDI